MSVTYTSTTGKPVIVGSYIIGVSPGLSLDNAVDELDVLVGISLNRTNTTALELKSNLQEIVNVIPVIIPNSSTVATNGSITLTALPDTYALGAWVYLPAGAIVGGAAGFYWTVFSSTTEGIVKTNYVDPSATEFLPYVPTGTLTTAVGSNSAYVTPTASDVALINITLPANTVSVGSALKAFCRVTCPSTANAKTVKHLLGTTTIGYQTFAGLTTGGILTTATFSRTNAKQITGTFGDSGSTATTFGTVNTAAESKFVITGQLAAPTEYIVLEAFTISQTFN